MGPVSGAESIVHKNPRVPGERLRKLRIVLFLLLIITGIFQKEHLAVLQASTQGCGVFANTIIREENILLEEFTKPGRNGLKGILLLTRFRGTSHVRAEHESCSPGKQFLDRGECRLNAGLVRDLELIVFGHIKVRPHQDFLTGDIDITNGKFTHSSKSLACRRAAPLSRFRSLLATTTGKRKCQAE